MMKTMISLLAYCSGLVLLTILSAADAVFDWLAAKDWSVFFLLTALALAIFLWLKRTRQIQNLVNDDKP